MFDTDIIETYSLQYYFQQVIMNDSTLVREAHEAFVTGHTGSTAIDVILAIFPVIPASLLAASFVKGRIGW